MGDSVSSHALGSVEVRWIAPRVLAWHLAGFIDTRTLDEALSRGRDLLASTEGKISTYVDMRALDWFSAGNPIRGVRWVQSNISRIERTALVIRPGPVVAVVRTFPLLLRGVDMAILTSPEAGLSFVGASDARGRIDDGRRRRKASGEQTVESQHEPLLARRPPR